MGKSNRDEFTAATKRALAARANYSCSFPGCGKRSTFRSSESAKSVVNVGIAAHIHAASPGFRRYSAAMTSQQRTDISNGIWLCANHSMEIDRDEKRFSPEVLHQMREEHERRMQEQGSGALPSSWANGQFAVLANALNNLTLVPATNFVGRHREIGVLVTSLRRSAPNSPTIANVHVIWGEPGMGKSALARRVTDDVENDYRIRWWIDAEDQTKIRAGLRELALKLGIASASVGVQTADSRADQLHEYLTDLRAYFSAGHLTGRALIVLDNVDSPTLKGQIQKAVLQFLPCEVCDVLVTSQAGEWDDVAVTSVRLIGLDTDHAMRLVAEISKRPELSQNEDVLAICELVSGRPLFLKLVASLLRDGDDPANFRALLANAPEDALDALPGEDEVFGLAWRRTYELSLQRVERASAGSAHVMEALTFLGNEFIPASLATQVGEQCVHGSTLQVRARLRALGNRSLLQTTEASRVGSARGYSVHRVIGGALRRLCMERGQLARSFNAAAAGLATEIPETESLRSPSGTKQMSALAPHARALVQHAIKLADAGVGSLDLGRASHVAASLSLHRRTLSEWEAAEDAGRVAYFLALTAGNVGITALRQAQLANVIRQRGRFTEAEILLSEALPLLQRHAHPRDYAWSLTVHGRVLRHRPNSAPEAALTELKKSLRILETLPTAERQQCERQLSELHGYISVLQRQLSNLSEAECEAKLGLEIIAGVVTLDEILEGKYLPSEPLFATHLRSLGSIWRLRGEFRRAMQAQHVALAVLERIYGASHTDVYRTLDSLGRAQRDWGAFDEALETFERASKISDSRFGIGHAHSATAAINRALVYLECGRGNDALHAAELGLSIYRAVYEESTDADSIRNEATAWALFVRADALAVTGSPLQALRDHEAVLAWRRHAYTEAHAHQASSLFAIAEVVWQQVGEDARCAVIAQHREALEIREAVFGREANFWLARSQARVGELCSDVRLVELAYKYYSEHLKEGHPRTCALRDVLDRIVSSAHATT